MKPAPESTLRALYAHLYPVEERKRRAALAIRFLLLPWLAAGIYNYVVVFATRFPEPARRTLVAAGFGLIGPVVLHLPLPPRFATSGLEIGSRVAAGLLLLLVARLLHPPVTIQTEIQNQAQRHAATQGREHPAEIARRLASQAPGVPLVRVGRRLIGVPYGADLGHIAVIAPTRFGKGLHLTQTLLTWPGAAVVVDPKGEQWQRTASWRASNIGPVYCLPPAGIDLLDYFSLGDPLDTQELHQHLIRPWQDKDPVFAEKCLALFTAAAQVGAATDAHALRVLAGWADQRAPIALQAAYPHARAAIDRFVDGDDPGRPNRFALTAWGIFSSRLAPLVPHLATWTTATVPHDWVVRRATIYLCYPLQQLTAAGPLLSALLAALLRGQMAQPERRPTLFAIDELPTVGLHNLAEYLATVGSAGITVLFYAQALTQLAAVYGEAGAQTILGNCHHQLYYPPRDLATAEQISAVFGTTLALTRSGGRGTRGARESVHEVNLRERGATDAECAVLVQRRTADCWEGERVELNAMDSVQFVRWLEERLEAAGVRKVVPEPAVLAATYRQVWRLARLQQLVAEVTAQARDADIALPDDLDALIRTRLTQHPARVWDDVVWRTPAARPVGTPGGSP